MFALLHATGLSIKVQKFVIFQTPIPEFVQIVADNWDSLAIRSKSLKMQKLASFAQ
jgi:hypothetical protein